MTEKNDSCGLFVGSVFFDSEGFDKAAFLSVLESEFGIKAEEDELTNKNSSEAAFMVNGNFVEVAVQPSSEAAEALKQRSRAGHFWLTEEIASKARLFASVQVSSRDENNPQANLEAASLFTRVCGALAGMPGAVGYWTSAVLAPAKAAAELSRRAHQAGIVPIELLFWVNFAQASDGVVAFTLGMNQFGLPEIAARASIDPQIDARSKILSLAYYLASNGIKFKSGDDVDYYSFTRDGQAEYVVEDYIEDGENSVKFFKEKI